jgi:hypothetical protein
VLFHVTSEGHEVIQPRAEQLDDLVQVDVQISVHEDIAETGEPAQRRGERRREDAELSSRSTALA